MTDPDVKARLELMRDTEQKWATRYDKGSFACEWLDGNVVAFSRAIEALETVERLDGPVRRLCDYALAYIGRGGHGERIALEVLALLRQKGE